MQECSSKKRREQQEFQQKLNEIVKTIKRKQEICLQIIEYLQHIFSGRLQLEKLMFLQDQITKHKSFLQKANAKILQFKEKQNKFSTLYLQPVQLTQTEKSLVKRVSARIIQLLQSFNQKVQKFSQFQKQISLHYKLIKPKFVKSINTIDKNGFTRQNLFQLFTLFFQYLGNKFINQSQKLHHIMQLIENGDIKNIQKAFICQHCEQFQRKAQTIRENNSQKMIKSSKDVEIKTAYQNQQSNFFSKQKQKINEKLKVMRLEAKQRQIIKKNKSKFASSCFHLYHSAMDLHKGHFIQQLTFINQREHTQKLLSQMLLKNKNNVFFVRQYIKVCLDNQMEQRIKNKLNWSTVDDWNQVSLQKIQIIQRRQVSDSIIEGNVQIDKEDNDISHCQNHSTFKNSCEVQQRIQMKSFRITNPNRKAVITTLCSNPNLFSIKQTGHSLNFVKINMKNQASNKRSRLPQISNRLFSMDDHRKSLKIVQKQGNFICANNNLLIIKTSLKQPDTKRSYNKKKQEQNHKLDNIEEIVEASLDRMQQRTNRLQPKNSKTESRHKKVKHSKSGNKLILQKNGRGSTKTLEVSYPISLAKKINKFCQINDVKEEVC